MIVECLEVGVFAENCYVVGCAETREAVVIDPGDEIPRILSAIEENRLEIKLILLTHAHLDHVKEVVAFKRHWDVPVVMHRDDEFLLANLEKQAAAFGLTTSGTPGVDRFVTEGETIEFGNHQFSVLHTPGHSPGSISFAAEGRIFAGDVLFASSIGRTDLPGGDFETLIKTIQDKLFVLGDATTVYPGHGPPTTIGQERTSNPFVRDVD